MSPEHATPGNGLLLFFRVNDFDLALQRARSLATRLEEEPHVNANTQAKEFSLRDPTDITIRSARSPLIFGYWDSDRLMDAARTRSGFSDGHLQHGKFVGRRAEKNAEDVSL
jgi:hypothetical protein